MELSPRARVGVVLAFVAMLLAAGMVGYGLGYQRGVWDGSASDPGTIVDRGSQQRSVPDVLGESLEAAWG